MKRSSGNSWSGLHQPLLELILQRLTLPDYLRFGSVCCAWRKAQTECVHPPAPIPFVVTPVGRTNYSFLSLSEKRTYKMQMPGHFKVRCISSSHGWLLLISYNTNMEMVFLLFNPFINKCVHLPRAGLYFDCLFFSTPSDPRGVLLVREQKNSFLLCRFDDQWQPRFHIQKWDQENRVVSNVIFCQRKLFALNKDWSLAVIDPLFLNNVSAVKMGSSQFPLPFSKSYEACVMVESCGEILMARTMDRSSSNLRLDVFRADLTKMEWVVVKTLGDCTLFLSTTSSISISASKTGWKRNFIYYIPNGLNILLRRTREDSDKLKLERSLSVWELGRDGRTIHCRSSMSDDKFISWVWVTPCLS